MRALTSSGGGARAIATTLALCLAAAAARAQDAGTSGERVRWERPPAGTIERGIYGVPEWVVIAVGALVIAASIATLMASARRGRRAR